MAFKLQEKVSTQDFIHPMDPAIDGDHSDIEAYREDWDFAYHCKLKEGEEPTLFKIKCDLPYRKMIEIDEAMTRAEKGQMKVTLGNHMHTAIKNFLIGIEDSCEDGIPFKKEHGLVSDSTMEELHRMGLIHDLYKFWSDMRSGGAGIKKSS